MKTPPITATITSTRIKKIREECLHISQKELAEKTGYSDLSIINYESGKTEPSMRFLIKLSEMTGISIDWICGQTEVRGQTKTEDAYLNIFHALINLQKIIKDIPDTAIHISADDNDGNIVINTHDSQLLKIINDIKEKQKLVNEDLIDEEFLDIWTIYISEKLKK